MKQSVLLLLILLICNPIMLPAQDADFAKAVDVINSKLKKWAEGGASVYVTVKVNGDISIINKRNQSLQFNLFDLAATPDNKMNSKAGIEVVPCKKKAHAPLAWINFYTLHEQVAFIRLHCNTPVSELESISSAFLRLKVLCSKKTSLSPADSRHISYSIAD